jgi:hypothetical protein
MSLEQQPGEREPSPATDRRLDTGAGIGPESGAPAPSQPGGRLIREPLGEPADAAARVRPKVREKIATRSLPCEPCKAVWGGAGSGAPCAACDRPILPSEIEFECEQPGDLLRFHQACYVLWEEECQGLERPPSPSTVLH